MADLTEREVYDLVGKQQPPVPTNTLGDDIAALKQNFADLEANAKQAISDLKVKYAELEKSVAAQIKAAVAPSVKS